MVVVLPQPFEPRKPKITPRGMRKLTLVSPHATGHVRARGHGLDGNHRSGTHEACSGRRAKSYRSLRKHSHRIADANAAPFGTREAGGKNIRAHEHLLVGQVVRHRCKVRDGIRNQQVLRLRAVDRIAEFPAADCLPSALGSGTVLRVKAAQAGCGRARRRDRAGNDTLTFAKATHFRAELFDDADRFVPDRKASGNRVFAFEDVNIGAADRGRGDADDSVERTGLGDRLLVEYYSAGPDEDRSFHLAHELAPVSRWRRGSVVSDVTEPAPVRCPEQHHEREGENGQHETRPDEVSRLEGLGAVCDHVLRRVDDENETEAHDELQ